MPYQTSSSRNLQWLSLVLILSLLLGTFLAQPVHAAPAAIHTVNSNNDVDDGACNATHCSLREAIAYASPGDTINIGLVWSIRLNSELVIDKALTINGTGEYLLVISGWWSSRVFNISGNPNHPTITIRDLTIADGRVDGSGAGMYNNSNNLTLTNVTFSNNAANSFSGNTYGGGMYNHYSSPTLNNVTFDGNSTTSTIGASYGGGMHNHYSNPTLTGVTFSNNSAYNGGGMYNYYSHPTLNAVTFSGNSGGGMINDTSSPMLNTVTFTNNSGGGMRNYQSDPALNNVTFSDNSSSFDGGGMYNKDSDPALNTVTFSNNSADYEGGGMYNENSNPALTDVTFSNNSATRGGGLYNYSGSATLTDVTFSSNSAYDGGGVYVNAGSATLTGTQVTGNTASRAGGGIYINIGSATFTETQILSNSANSGGGIYINTGSATLTGTQVLSNSAAIYGGGVYLWSGSAALDVNGGAISHNSAGSWGGGALIGPGSMSLNGTQVLGNSALNGGGMYFLSSSPTLTNTAFSGNTAVNNGGGIFTSAGSPTLVNTTFSENSAQDGGGLFNSNSSPRLTNTILWGNTAANAPSSQISNTLGSTPAISYTLIQSATVGGVWDTGLGTDGGNNLDANPHFVRDPNPGSDGTWDTADDDYGDLHLQTDSPAINTGSNTNCPTTDLDGTPRPFGPRCDMGAYETAYTLTKVYVNGAANGVANGLTWTHAYTNVQDALALAVSGVEIWVAEGVYYPDEGAAQSDNNPWSTFTLKDGVAIYGGFTATETLRTQRDWAVHPTILSGDMGGDDNNVDGNFIAESTGDIVGQNVVHVISSSGMTSSAVLDGFTITAGAAWSHNGGGMDNNNSSPTLNNLTFSGNLADNGGGMSNGSSSNPALTNVNLYGNYAANAGGGMYNHSGSSPTLTNVTFSGNAAAISGGGIANDGSNPTLTHATFSGNSAGHYGGGLFNYLSNPTLTNAILWGNTAAADSQISNSASTLTISYSDIQGGYAGTGNINADPLFVDAANGNLRLQYGSPAIDTADNVNCPTADLDGVSRPYGSRCDMGAYETVYTLTQVYVNQNQAAVGGANGLSWTHAYTNVQDALSLAVSGVEIWVAAGVYYPDEGAGQISNAVASTFVLTDGVSLYGGFAATETLRSERNWETNVTILSGDIDHETLPDTTLNGVVTSTAHIIGSNAYHVVSGSGVTNTAVLDGFTITAGQANGFIGLAQSDGGGMYNASGSPTLANLIFSGNLAYDYGGGMYNYESSPVLTEVDFAGNSAYDGGGMYNEWYSSPTLTDTAFIDNMADGFNGRGGGMYNVGGSSPSLTRAAFTNNSAADGGGMYNIHGNTMPILTAVTFTGNSATGGDFMNGGGGGGMYNNFWSSPVLTNVAFISNTSAAHGGGMVNKENSAPTLTEVTFSRNSAAYGGGGMYHDGSAITRAGATFTGSSAGGDLVSSGNGRTSSVLSDGFSLVNVTFSGNTALYGGGLSNFFSSSTLTNVVFVGNTVADAGGGMLNYGASPMLANVTFSGNAADAGGGMVNITDYAGNGSHPRLTNAILWGNTATNTLTSQISNTLTSTPAISYTLIQSATASGSWDTALGFDVGNNIDADPIFVRNPHPGSDGIWGTVDDDDGDLRLQGGSPALDSGDNGACPATDLRGQNRDDWDCDMGAYETQFSDADTISKNVTSGNTYTFGPTLARVQVINANCLTALTIQRVEANHPNATSGIATGRYWAITPTGCASGFGLTLTLPTALMPDGNDKLCRYTGSGWDCGEVGDHSQGAGPAAMPNTIIRQNVTQLSDWAVGDDVGPTAVTLQSISATSVNQFWTPLLLILVWGLLLGMMGIRVWKVRKY